MKNYKVITRKTVSTSYRGYKLFSTSAPSSGSVALNIIKVIEKYNMSDPSLEGLNIHRVDEAMRWAYAARGELGDPDFFKDMENFEEKMLHDDTIEKIRSKISDARTRDPSKYGSDQGKVYFQPENHGTSHIVATDRSGLSISLTSTVNLLFGSHLMVPETGEPLSSTLASSLSLPPSTHP